MWNKRFFKNCLSQATVFHFASAEMTFISSPIPFDSKHIEKIYNSQIRDNKRWESSVNNRILSSCAMSLMTAMSKSAVAGCAGDDGGVLCLWRVVANKCRAESAMAMPWWGQRW